MKGSLTIENLLHQFLQSKIILKKMIRRKFSIQVGFSLKETKWSNNSKTYIRKKLQKKLILIGVYAHHYKNNSAS